MLWNAHIVRKWKVLRNPEGVFLGLGCVCKKLAVMLANPTPTINIEKNGRKNLPNIRPARQ